MLIIEASEIREKVRYIKRKGYCTHTSNVWTLESHIPGEELLYLNAAELKKYHENRGHLWNTPGNNKNVTRY